MRDPAEGKPFALNIRLDPFTAGKLKALAAASGMSLNGLISEAVKEYCHIRLAAVIEGERVIRRFADFAPVMQARTTKEEQAALHAAQRQALFNPSSQGEGDGSAQEPVPAEPAQMPQEQEQTADMPQAAPVPSDSGQVATSSPVDMQQAADAQAPVPAMQDAQDTAQADMQESADAAEAGDSSRDIQDGSSMSEQLGQDALQLSSPAGSGPGSQDAAQDSGQDAPMLEAQCLPVQGSLLASLRRMVRENAAQDAGQDAGDAGPSIEELKARALELKAQGLTQSQIAKEIGRSEASVSRYLRAAK